MVAMKTSHRPSWGHLAWARSWLGFHRTMVIHNTIMAESIIRFFETTP